MTLAASLLEGYGYHGNANGSSNESIQQITADFLLESSNLFQTYLTAEIVGQVKVVTEGACPDVLLEGTVKTYLHKMLEAIKTFIGKIRKWIGDFIKKIKERWKKFKSSKKKKDVDKELKKRDRDEELQVPADAPKIHPPAVVAANPSVNKQAMNSNIPRLPGSTTNEITIIDYKLDDGFGMFNDVCGKIDELIEPLFGQYNEDVKIDFNQTIYKSLDSFKETFRNNTGADPDNIDEFIIKAFGADCMKTVTLTVEQANEILDDSSVNMAMCIDDLEESIRENDEWLKKVEQQWSTINNKSSVPDDVLQKLQTSYTITTYILQLNSKICSTMQSIAQGYMDQVDTIYTILGVSLDTSSAVGEAVDPNLDDSGNDEPVEDEPVSEGSGTNTKVLKTYLYECRDYIKELKKADNLFNKEDYSAAKKAYAAVKAKMEKTNKNLVELAKDADLTTDLLAIPTTIVTSIVVGFDECIRNFWLNKDITTARDVIKSQDATHGSRNPNITTVMSKMNACIERCERQMVACDKRSGVSESSLFEQASYLVF